MSEADALAAIAISLNNQAVAINYLAGAIWFGMIANAFFRK